MTTDNVDKTKKVVLSQKQQAAEQLNKLFVRIKRSSMIAGDGEEFIDALRGIKTIYVEDFIDDEDSTKNEFYKGYLNALTDLLDQFAGCDKAQRPAQGE